MKLRRQKFPESRPDYECSRCGESLACDTLEEILRVKTHRLLHLAVESSHSLRLTTGWVTDADGGMRPVTD